MIVTNTQTEEKEEMYCKESELETQMRDCIRKGIAIESIDVTRTGFKLILKVKAASDEK